MSIDNVMTSQHRTLNFWSVYRTRKVSIDLWENHKGVAETLLRVGNDDVIHLYKRGERFVLINVNSRMPYIGITVIGSDVGEFFFQCQEDAKFFQGISGFRRCKCLSDVCGKCNFLEVAKHFLDNVS